MHNNNTIICSAAIVLLICKNLSLLSLWVSICYNFSSYIELYYYYRIQIIIVIELVKVFACQYISTINTKYIYIYISISVKNIKIT